MGIGSQWQQSYALQNSDGSLFNTAGKIFSFVVRNDPSEAGTVTPAIRVTTTPGAQGQITVTGSTVAVTLTPAATAIMSQKTYVYSLWMDQGLTDATAWVTGTIFAAQIANA
jgi:hypothetical protein